MRMKIEGENKDKERWMNEKDLIHLFKKYFLFIDSFIHLIINLFVIKQSNIIKFVMN